MNQIQAILEFLWSLLLEVARFFTKQRSLDKPRCLLIVEDNADDAEVAREAVESNGFKCDVARSAEEGRGLLKAKRHNVALVDIKLPGMDGCSLAEWIMNESPRTHVVMVVGEPALMTGLRSGVYVGIILKPITARSIRDIIGTLK